MFRSSIVMLWAPRYRWAPKIARPAFAASSTTSASPGNAKEASDSPSSTISRNFHSKQQNTRPHVTYAVRWKLTEEAAPNVSASSSSSSLEQDVEDALLAYRRCKSAETKRAMKFDMKTLLVPRIAATFRSAVDNLNANKDEASLTTVHQLATFLRLLALANVEDGRPIADGYRLLWEKLRTRPVTPIPDHSEEREKTNPRRSVAGPRKEDLLTPHDICSIFSSGSRIGFLTDECLQMLLDHDIARQMNLFNVGHLCELVVSIGRFSIRDNRFEKVAAKLQKRRHEIDGRIKPLLAVELIRQLSMARPIFRELVDHLASLLAEQARRGAVSTRVLNYVNKLLQAMDSRSPALERAFLRQASRKGIVRNTQSEDDDEAESAAYYDIVTADLVKMKYTRS